MQSDQGVRVAAPTSPATSQILTPEAIRFVVSLTRRFRPRLEELLSRRQEVQARMDAGETPDFHPETQHIRETSWQVLASIAQPAPS